MALHEVERQKNLIKDNYKTKDTFDHLDEIQNAIYKMKIKEVPEVLTLKDLITELHKVFEDDHINIEYIHSLLAAYKSNPSEWRKFAKFDRYRYYKCLPPLSTLLFF